MLFLNLRNEFITSAPWIKEAFGNIWLPWEQCQTQIYLYYYFYYWILQDIFFTMKPECSQTVQDRSLKVCERVGKKIKVTWTWKDVLFLHFFKLVFYSTTWCSGELQALPVWIGRPSSIWTQRDQSHCFRNRKGFRKRITFAKVVFIFSCRWRCWAIHLLKRISGGARKTKKRLINKKNMNIARE